MSVGYIHKPALQVKSLIEKHITISALEAEQHCVFENI